MTLGPPIHGQARFLDPETLAMAKAEFEMLEYHGIVRHSDSLWATPLHMVQKPGGRGYHGLYGSTTPAILFFISGPFCLIGW